MKNPFTAFSSHDADYDLQNLIRKRDEEQIAVLQAAITRLRRALGILQQLPPPLRYRSLHVGPVIWPHNCPWNYLGQYPVEDTAARTELAVTLYRDVKWCNGDRKRVARIARQIDAISAWCEKRYLGKLRHAQHIKKQQEGGSLSADAAVVALRGE